MTLTPWQRANILGALNHLKELARASKDARADRLAQGLHEVLEPSRRTIRLQRESAQSATAAVSTGRERRMGKDRRAREDRRRKPEAILFPDRRTRPDRRATDRRGTSY